MLQEGGDTRDGELIVGKWLRPNDSVQIGDKAGPWAVFTYTIDDAGHPVVTMKVRPRPTKGADLG